MALDIRDCHAPFPSVLLLHEMRVRGFRPFLPLTRVPLPENITWQDWILKLKVFDEDNNSFRREVPSITPNEPQLQLPPEPGNAKTE